MKAPPRDPSHGYDALAEEFTRRRDPEIGVRTVQRWSRDLPPGAAVLDLGAGDGVPISRALVESGFEVHAVDASPAMVAAFGRRFPQLPVACEPAEESRFFDRSFDGVVAWGLLFLMEPIRQRTLINRVARSLADGGSFLFTAPWQRCTWTDALTGLESISLGREGYREALAAAGLRITAEYDDEGGNHYFASGRAYVAAET